MHAHTILLLAHMALFSQATPPDRDREGRSLHANFEDTVFEHNKDFILTTDSIFTPIETVHINPDYAIFTKSIDLTSVEDSKNLLTEFHTEHIAVCQEMHDNDKEHNDLFITPLHENTYVFEHVYKHAEAVCQEIGHTLVQATTLEEQKALYDFLEHHRIFEVYADVAYTPTSETLATPGTIARLTQTGYLRICDETNPATETDISTYFGTYYKQSLPLAFKRNGPYLSICPVYDNKSLRTVCQRRERPGHLESMAEEIEFCNARSTDIKDTIFPLAEALNTLHSIISPEQGTTQKEKRDMTESQTLQTLARYQKKIEIKATNSTASDTTEIHAEHQRTTRQAAFAAVALIGAMTMITSIINSLADTASHVTNAKNIGTLAVQSETIRTNQLQLESHVQQLDRIVQNHVNLVEKENRIYTAFIRVISSVQDNIIVYSHLLDSIMNSQMSTFMLSKDEITTLARRTLEQTSQRMSTNPTDYTVKPIYNNGKLSISIEIPLIDPSKQATIYSIRNFPIFKDGKQFVQKCDEDYIAIYENSDHYNTLTRLEYRDCVTRRNRCTSGGPQFTKAIDNCAARQFLGTFPQNVVHKQLSHETPFFLTVGNKTIYSVAKPMRIELHCPEVDKPGPDFTFTISDRGHFINPTGTCSFTAEGVNFVPSLPKFTKTTVQHDYFQMSTDPTLFNFPTKIRLQAIALDRVQPLQLSDPTHATKTTVIIVGSLIALIFTLIVVLILFLFHVRRKVNRKIRKIMSAIWSDSDHEEGTEMSETKLYMNKKDSRNNIHPCHPTPPTPILQSSSRHGAQTRPSFTATPNLDNLPNTIPPPIVNHKPNSTWLAVHKELNKLTKNAPEVNNPENNPDPANRPPGINLEPVPDDYDDGPDPLALDQEPVQNQDPNPPQQQQRQNGPTPEQQEELRRLYDRQQAYLRSREGGAQANRPNDQGQPRQ